MWDLPGPGLEPVSPALAGGFLTTAPPGKSPAIISSNIFFFPILSHISFRLSNKVNVRLSGNIPQLLDVLVFFGVFIYFWLHWVFVAVRGLSLVAASGGYSSLRCTGFSLQWLLLLQSTGSVVVACGL